MGIISEKRNLFVGAMLAFLTCGIGSFVFIELVAGMDFIQGLQFYRAHQMLGKIITLGAILNLLLFFVLLKKNKEQMARGVVLGLIVLTVVTLVI